MIEVIVYKPRASALAAMIALVVTATLTFAATACGGDDDAIERPVAFITDGIPGELQVLNADLSKTVVSSSASDPKWSPNGARLAFIEQDPARGTSNLIVWRREENETFPISGGHNQVVRYFWAPDSNRIAFESNSGAGASIYVVSTVVEDDAPFLVTTENIGDLELGNWSGNNRLVVMRLVTSEGPGIFVRNVSGVNELRLTHGDDYRPRFSPDGRDIAFSRRNADGSTDIHILNLESDDDAAAPEPTPARMTSSQGTESDYEWSPNGRYISYVTEEDGDSEIYVLDIDGGTTGRLTSNRVEDRHPRWSRGDSSILFVSDSDGDFDVFQMDLDSRQQRRVISSDESELIADW